MKKTKPVSPPWNLDVEGNGKEIFITAEDKNDAWKRLFCTVSKDDCDKEVAIASAKLIVKAVNNYENMVKALEEIALSTDAEVYRHTNKEDRLDSIHHKVGKVLKALKKG
jgi:uncharacterized protein Yka (UPF0111/DUF47 family)